MKKTVVGFLDILHHFALMLWLGGMVLLGFLVAPALFQTSLLAETDAQKVFHTLLSRFTVWVEVCGVVMVVVQFLLRRRYQKQKSLFILDAVRQLSTFGALLLAEMCFRNLLPNLNANRRVGELADVRSLGGMYSTLAIAQAITLIVVLIITVWLSLPQSMGTPRRTATQEEPPTPAPRAKSRRRRA